LVQISLQHYCQTFSVQVLSLMWDKFLVIFIPLCWWQRSGSDRGVRRHLVC
jgi:hypothetical protein